ncbi:hypothetical protein WICMUC_004895 [Wickerhamomyces mucosus]|uniref:Chromatin modification-related protein EAF6 n=1 Tax=Wickerhamomyces mucosus TaxID=1378264 RepID=A0A9P8T9S7_9ASCO|nr:hypothetical protein WICMUC_004895 [Wickerhamomyces mucosus]
MSQSESLKEYETLKKQLQDAILRKKTLDKEITQIEENIFQKETIYLSESNNSNIVRGFETSNKQGSHNSSFGSVNKKKLIFTDDDRVFSLSSHTFVRHLQKKNDLEDEQDDISNESTPNTAQSNKKRRRDD